MNERITEIARTAGAKVSEIDAGYGIITKTVLYDEDIEEFAEKIIRECAKIADNGYGSDNFGNGIAGYQLLNRFGIKK